MTIPPLQPSTIEMLGNAVYPSFAMLAGMQLGLFTALGERPMDAAQLATAMGVGPAKLRPLLYGLVAAELLTVHGERFANTPEADHFLVQGKPAYLGGRHEHFAARWNDALHAGESVRTGKAQTKLEFSEMSQDHLESFLRGLHPNTLASGRNLVAQYDFSAYHNLLDVGGGSGGLAIAITEACPNLRGTVLDLPTVTPLTQQFLEEAGAADRVDVINGDAINGPLTGSYDVAVLSSFIQVLSPDEARRALANLSQVIEPGGEIFILGRVLDDSRISPAESVGINLVFISVYDGGQAYTEQEHRDWLTEAGFENIERVVLFNGTSIVTARKSG